MQEPQKEKIKMGRPRADIDWKVVDDLLQSGCMGTEVAAFLGICADALYNRVEQEFNMTFSAYSQQKKQTGDSLLKKAQFDKAIGNTEKGDNTLLIWLGKTRLEQRETTEHLVAPETLKTFSTIMDQIAEMQQKRYNSPSEKPNTEESNEAGDVRSSLSRN